MTNNTRIQILGNVKKILKNWEVKGGGMYTASEIRQ